MQASAQDVGAGGEAHHKGIGPGTDRDRSILVYEYEVDAAIRKDLVRVLTLPARNGLGPEAQKIVRQEPWRRELPVIGTKRMCIRTHRAEVLLLKLPYSQKMPSPEE